MRNAYRSMTGNPGRKRQLEKYRHKFKNNVKKNSKIIEGSRLD